MTSSVTFPAAPILSGELIENHVLEFLRANPQGVRNADVGRSLGYNDTRQWFSYGILDKLMRRELVEKDERSLYFAVD